MLDDPDRDAASAAFLDQLFAIHRRARVVGAQMYRRIGLHRTQVVLLGAVGRMGDARLADLACEQEVDPSVISRQIVALEQSGLVVRRPDPEDRRASLLRLTEEGSATLARAVDVYREAVASWLADWSTEEIWQTAQALNRMTGPTGPPETVPGSGEVQA